jgi:fructokinase
MHRDAGPWKVRIDLGPDDARLFAARAFPRDRVVAARLFESGGVNTCLRVELADRRPVVLRVYSAADASRICARERDLLQALRPEVPVPELIDACPGGGEMIGPFLVLELVEGVTFRELKRVGPPDDVQEAAYSVGAALAAIGRVRFRAPGRLGPGLQVSERFGSSPDPYVAHLPHCMTSPAAQRRLAPATRERLVTRVRARAYRLRDVAAASSLVHGDLGAANLIVRREQGAFRVAAVIDWEFAFSGSPLVDIGHFLRYERDARPLREPAFSRGYLDAGGKLPEDWRDLARTVDLADLCAILSREDAPADAVNDVIALVQRTLDA